MNRVRKTARLWERQRPTVLATRERGRRALRGRRNLDQAVTEREERDRARDT